MPKTYGQYCALARALDHIGDRWTLLIVRELLLGPARFTDLLGGLPGIATNLLTERLRSLEADGLVRRTPRSPSHRSFAYELTETGRELQEPVHGLIRWGRRWMLDGPDGDHFRVDWLLLALQALTQTARPPLPKVTVAIRCRGTAITLHARRQGIILQRGEPLEPDLAVEGDPDALLGLFAGAIPVESAPRRGGLRIRGNDEPLKSLLVRLKGLDTSKHQ